MAQLTFPTTTLPKLEAAGTRIDADVLIVGVTAGAGTNEAPAPVLMTDAHPEQSVREALTAQLAALGVSGKVGEAKVLPASDAETTGAPVIIAAGLGETATATSIRRAAGAAARAARALKPQRVATTLSLSDSAAAAEGLALGWYDYPGEKKEAKPAQDVTFLLAGDADPKESTAIARAVFLARDLVNTASSSLYPETYAEAVRSLATAETLTVEVLAEDELKAEGFGGLLAVGLGSSRGPRLVRVEYAPRAAKRHVALVGKGITFDTGGISLKPGANMEEMISDMGGSAVVLGTVLAAAELELDVKVTAYLCMAENMPSGTAYRPGDIVTNYGGLTTEILNTDAEGRMVLADGIARAAEDQPDLLIDTATLTGAQMVALGAKTAGVMGTEAARERVTSAYNEVDEAAWAMPIPEEAKESVKSPVADLRNVTGNRNAGMLAAAAFLQSFVPEGMEWAHVDIAGPAWNDGGAEGFLPARATGFGVRGMLSAIRN